MSFVGRAIDGSRRRADLAATDDDDLALWHASIQECRVRSLEILLVSEFIVGWLIAVPFLDLWPKLPAGLGWCSVSLILGAGATFIALRARYSLAAVCLVASLFLGSAISFRTVDSALTICSFALVVGAAAVVIGPAWTRGVAIAATAWLLLSTRGTTALDDGMVFSSIALLWAVMFLTWLGHRPLNQSLEWAMSSHLDARKRAEEAERHRGALGRVVKSLTETHERLEHLTAELDRARLAAENARSLKAKFAAYISHELRTPLNLIIGFSEMMVLAPHTYGDAVLPPAYRGDINAIYQSARHLATLINDVLDLSQIDAHRMALDRDDVPVCEVIDESVGTVEAAYAEKGLTIEVRVDEGLPVLYIDRTRIRQVLINLLGNALRFTERGGVTIIAVRDRRDVLFTVADTGVGIPEAELPRLFDDFRQAERPEAEGGEGSGLGLAIARRFVALHGGWIKAESEVGRGTHITFALPASHTLADILPSTTSDDFEAARSSPPTLPVVAVDADDPWLLRTSQRYLDGYRIVPADAATLSADGNCFRREGVSAVILSTPSDSNGWERLRAMTHGRNGVPVICCSLRGGREAIARLGVADYVDKPFTRARLAQVLSRWRPGRGSRTILVVDDDQNMVRLLTRMIHSISRRYRVLKAFDGAMALDLMRESRPDLVLMDLLMPRVDGYEVLDRMRQDESLKSVPVVVVTARGMDDDVISAGMFGIARSGGFPAGELMRCLQATLDNLNAPTADVAPPALATASPG